MSDLIDRAADYAEKAHATQLRKYTGERYFVHLCEVAAICAEHKLSEAAIAAAYLHDVIEDQPVTFDDLLQEFGAEIAGMVLDLTNQPPLAGLNRARRHENNCARLAFACSEVQSIKCADLLSNTASIVQHDPGFAVKYMEEKRDILNVLTRAKPSLLAAARASLQAAEAVLAERSAARKCDECGQHAVQVAQVDQEFVYGETDKVTLCACVPVWTCSACGEAYTDGDAEELRHQAVLRHLAGPAAG